MAEKKKTSQAEEVDETTEKIRKIVGVIPNFSRPPYIAVDDKMFEAVGLPFIEGIGAEDWEDSVSASERVERILNQIEDGTVFHNALKKYGKENFLFYVIGEFPDDKLNSLERFYIKKFNTYREYKNIKM